LARIADDQDAQLPEPIAGREHRVSDDLAIPLDDPQFALGVTEHEPDLFLGRGVDETARVREGEEPSESGAILGDRQTRAH